jgi:hypothetical protein
VTHCNLTELGCGQLSENGGKLHLWTAYHPFTPSSLPSLSLYPLLKPLSVTLNVKFLSLTLRKLFSTFSSLLNPPPPPSSLSADDFVNHFETKAEDICSSFTQPINPATIEVQPPDNLPARPHTISGDLPFLTSHMYSFLIIGCVPSVIKMARFTPSKSKRSSTLTSTNADRYPSFSFQNT